MIDGVSTIQRKGSGERCDQACGRDISNQNPTLGSLIHPLFGAT